MSPLDALSRILILTRTLDTTFTAAQDTKLPQVQIGQQVAAKVEEALPGGNFRVSIGAQPLQMSLPQGTKPGDTVGLVLVAREPRLTFRLDPQTQPTGLSQTGRMISQLLPDASRPSAPVTQSHPVLPSPPLDAKTVAQSLKQTLSGSGLFYESHLSQWVKGERPLAQIRLEPQNRLPPAPLPAGEAPQAAGPQANAAVRMPAPPEAPPAQAPGQGAEPPAALQIAAPDLPPTPSRSDPAQDAVAATSSHAAKVHDALPIVRQQIETLENREFVWAGQIWPGQDMDWQISEDGQGPGAPEETAQRWQSRLRLVLPSLGEVEANLSLSPQGVKISMDVASAAAEDRLKGGAKALLDRLDSSGIALLSMAVRHG